MPKYNSSDNSFELTQYEQSSFINFIATIQPITSKETYFETYLRCVKDLDYTDTIDSIIYGPRIPIVEQHAVSLASNLFIMKDTNVVKRMIKYFSYSFKVLYELSNNKSIIDENLLLDIIDSSIEFTKSSDAYPDLPLDIAHEVLCRDISANATIEIISKIYNFIVDDRDAHYIFNAVFYKGDICERISENISVEVIDYMYNHFEIKDNLYKYFVKCHKTPSNILDDICNINLKSKDGSILEYIIANPNTSTETIEKLTNSRISGAYHTIGKLARDEIKRRKMKEI